MADRFVLDNDIKANGENRIQFRSLRSVMTTCANIYKGGLHEQTQATLSYTAKHFRKYAFTPQQGELKAEVRVTLCDPLSWVCQTHIEPQLNTVLD